MAHSQSDLYEVVTNEDGKWYVIDGQVIVDGPIYSKDAALQRRDDLNMALLTRLGEV